MKNKNILIISHLYPSPQNPTKGIFVHKQAKSLVAAGYNVEVISPAVFGKKTGQGQYTMEGINVRAPKYLSGSRLFASYTDRTAYLGAKRLLRVIDFTPDVILAHTALPDGGLAQILSKKLGIPYFVYVHGADVQHKVAYNKRTRKKITSILFGAKKVLVNSSKTKRLVGDLGINSVIVPMGVDAVGAKSKIPIRRAQGLRQNTKRMRLVSICNLQKEKGIQFVLGALKDIADKNIEYRIIGDGEYMSSLEKYAKNDKRIRFLGRLDQKRVFGQLQNSDIFVLPSYNEAFGVAFLEAMSFGLPIIGVKGEGVEDIVARGECGILVEPESSDSVRKALIKLISDSDLRRSMGKNGRRIVKENYLWNDIGKSLIQELEK